MNSANSVQIDTPRLVLREFREADLNALAALYSDPQTMRFLGKGETLSRADTWRQIAVILGHQVLRGYTILALEDRATGELIGRCGPWFPEGWPMLEVGWLVAPSRQRQGIATEAGAAALAFCFSSFDVDQVSSVIYPDNLASARVAQKLGGRIARRIEMFGQDTDLWIYDRPADLPRPTELRHVPQLDSGGTIETERLRLRPFRDSDLDNLARLYADPQVMRYIGDGSTLSRAEAWRAIAHFRGHGLLRGYTTLAIEDRQSGAFLGECGPWRPEGWPSLEVGWLVDPQHQGRGIATEAGRAAVQWCFEHLGVDQVSSFVHPDNRASQRVAAKLGARHEGQITLSGQPADVWVHRR